MNTERKDIEYLRPPTTNREVARMARFAMAEVNHVRAIVQENLRKSTKNPRTQKYQKGK